MGKLFSIASVMLLLCAVAASGQGAAGVWEDAPVNRVKPSLKGVDSASVYVQVAVPNTGISTLKAELGDYLTHRLDSIGIGATRNPVSFPTAYITLYVFGLTRSTDGDDAPDEIIFNALMQVERYVQIREGKTLSDEQESPSMAATWKKQALGYCPIDSLSSVAFDFVKPWTDTLLIEINRANR